LKITNVAAVRPATCSDASAISALYVRIYTPAGDGDARDSYPFPQLMNPDAVAAMIAGGEYLWLVGEAPVGTIVGSAAAVRNIGDAQDQIAEVFGVVVDAAYRHGGLGSCLVRGLVDELTGVSAFILCEARTDDAGGWKVARNAGFRPVGYEPYAHSMPVGFESMVLTGRWRPSLHPNGLDVELSWMGQAHRLRSAVMGAPSAAGVSLRPTDIAQGQEAPPLGTDVSIRRDDDAGRRWFDRPAVTFDRNAGIIELHPLQGVDHRSSRFTHAYYLASSASSEVGAARVVYDRVDARARVLGLRTAAPQARPALLQYIVNDLSRLTGDGHLVIIVLVDSTCNYAHVELISLGFFPTAYLPAFIAAPQGRSDVVQYTRLAGCSLRESTNGVTAKHWSEAEKVISQVLSFAS
jgi:ribosomal protein S18 acetylase RimI-like enzyme